MGNYRAMISKKTSVLIESILLILMSYSCKDSNKDYLYKSVRSFYNQCKEDKKQECIIDFKDIIKQDWDSVYIFGGNGLSDKISQLKRVDHLILSESPLQKIIFIKKDSVVYQVGYGPLFNQDDEMLHFNFDNILFLSRDNAKFKINSENGKLLQLRHE